MRSVLLLLRIIIILLWFFFFLLIFSPGRLECHFDPYICPDQFGGFSQNMAGQRELAVPAVYMRVSFSTYDWNLYWTNRAARNVTSPITFSSACTEHVISVRILAK